MLDLVAMWKSPKMIVLMLLTAVLYVVSLYPFLGLSFFGGYADFGRIGVAIPVAFSFLFGPAAAWGAAIGNIICDIAVLHVDAASVFGFIGNLLIGYIPYKIWNAITTEKPDLRSVKKFLLFAGIGVFACTICGLIIGWGLYLLGFTPFMPSALIIAFTNVLWAVTVGSIVLALTYNYVSKRKLLYTDILNLKPKAARWNKTRSIAILAFSISTILIFYIGQSYNLNAFVLLPFMAVSLIATGIACR